jgi:ABC-type Mn2+/Zn2+ transport system permease subunit
MLTDSFGRMLGISTVVGLACGLIGMYLSYYAGVPSGTMIVLVGAVAFLVVFAVTGIRGRERAAGVDDHSGPRAKISA